MSAEAPALVDANVLIYAADEAAIFHTASRTLRDRGTAGELSLCVTPQILWEYFAVITNAKRVLSPRSVEEAWAEVASLRALFRVLSPPEDLVDRILVLTKTVSVRSAQVFDLTIAATALAAGINTIYSYDSTVFNRVPGITVREP